MSLQRSSTLVNHYWNAVLNVDLTWITLWFFIWLSYVCLLPCYSALESSLPCHTGHIFPSPASILYPLCYWLENLYVSSSLLQLELYGLSAHTCAVAFPPLCYSLHTSPHGKLLPVRARLRFLPPCTTLPCPGCPPCIREHLAPLADHLWLLLTCSPVSPLGFRWLHMANLSS